MPAFLNHLRLFNLALIALTMILVRYTIIVPFLQMEGSRSSVNALWFAALVLSVVLIAAGGYFINDSEDEMIDSINKAGVGKRMNAADLRFYGILFLITGVMAGALISVYGELKTVWGINMIAAVLLLGYSRFLKRMVLLAGLTVSLLSALIVVVVFTSDQAATQNLNIRNLIAGYSIFAFLLSFIRENIKDLEDINGDIAAARKTLPLVAGVMASKTVIVLFAIITLLLLVWIQVYQKQWENFPAFLYVVLLIEIPLAVLSVKIIRDKNSAQFHLSNRICRYIMLAGVLTMPFFYFLF